MSGHGRRPHHQNRSSAVFRFGWKRGLEENFACEPSRAAILSPVGVTLLPSEHLSVTLLISSELPVPLHSTDASLPGTRLPSAAATGRTANAVFARALV